VAIASFACVLYTKGHGLATGCQAAASSGPVGRKLSVSLGSLGFWPKKKEMCARRSVRRVANLASSWLVYKNNNTTVGEYEYPYM